MNDYKICSDCEKQKPATLEFFPRRMEKKERFHNTEQIYFNILLLDISAVPNLKENISFSVL